MKRKWIRVCLWLMALLLTAQGGALAMMVPEGQEEGYRLYMERRAEMLSRLGVHRLWPLEEKAALDAYREELGLFEPEEAIRGMPGPESLSQAEALDIARDTVVEAYGVDRALLETYQTEYDFFTGASGAYWRLRLESEVAGEVSTAFAVEVASPSGEPRLCEETYSRLLPEAPWPHPAEADDIPEAEAERIAREYALEHFEGRQPIPPEVLAVYRTITRIYLLDDLGRVYGVELNPFDEELFSYYGTFTVYLDPKTGIVWQGTAGNG